MFIPIDYKPIKTNILDFSSVLLLGIEDFEPTGIVYCFQFTSKQLKNDENLRTMLFGSTFTNGHFRPKKTIFKALMRYYSDCIRTDIYYTKTAINAICQAENINAGYALEKLLVTDGFIKASAKQDKNQKIDVIENGKRIQVKCAMLSDKKAYSITNGNV